MSVSMTFLRPEIVSLSCPPGFALCPGTHPIGLFIPDERFFHGIERHLAPQHPGDGRGMTGNMGMTHHVGTGGGGFPALQAIEEIAGMLRRVGTLIDQAISLRL